MAYELVYKRPSAIPEKAISGFCPGCLHSAACKLIAEVIDEMDLAENSTYVKDIGCCALTTPYLVLDNIASLHGRACAVATAAKRCDPKQLVISYQGDGALASIGLAETMSAANRGENFTVIFINNCIYGMTGGQMAPTTLVGTKTTTSPYGRDPKEHGYPLHMAEIIGSLKAPAYVARVTCTDPANIRKAKAAVKKAFEYQMAGKGFTFVEFISNCPTNWSMSPEKSLQHIKDTILPEFPLGVFKDVGTEE